ACYVAANCLPHLVERLDDHMVCRPSGKEARRHPDQQWEEKKEIKDDVHVPRLLIRVLCINADKIAGQGCGDIDTARPIGPPLDEGACSALAACNAGRYPALKRHSLALLNKNARLQVDDR